MNTAQFLNFKVELPPLEVTKNHSFYKVIPTNPDFLGSVIAVKNQNNVVVTQRVTVNGCKAEIIKISKTLKV